MRITVHVRCSTDASERIEAKFSGKAKRPMRSGKRMGLKVTKFFIVIGRNK